VAGGGRQRTRRRMEAAGEGTEVVAEDTTADVDDDG
jgi:hypothetical protein